MEDNIVASVFEDPAIGQAVPYASLGQRLVNFIVDTIVFSITLRVLYFVIALLMALGGADQDSIIDLFYNPLFSVSTYLLMFVLTWAIIEGVSKGRSLGKVITRTIVVKTDLSPVTFKDTFLRSVSRLVPFEPVSIFFNLENSMWHDGWSKTIVIKKNRMNF